MELKFTPRNELSEFEWEDTAQKWDRPKLDPKTLQELTRPNTLSSVLRLGFFLVLLLGSAAATVFVGRYHIWLAIPVLYGYYFFFGFLLALAHELQHRTVFAKSLDWLNDILFFIVQVLIWNSPRYHRVSHRLHHRYTMVRGRDPETNWAEVFDSRWVKDYFRGLVFRMLLVGAVIDWLRTVVVLAGQVLGKKDAMMCNQCTDDDVRAIRIQAAAILLIHGGIVAAAVWRGWWPLLVFITTAWFVGGAIEFLWHQTEHIGRAYNVRDQRLCTRSVRVSPFIKAFYWGLDDHVEHHLFPGVPSCNLPKLHTILNREGYLPKPQPMVACWREMFAIANEKDTHPDHEYVPVDIKS